MLKLLRFVALLLSILIVLTSHRALAQPCAKLLAPKDQLTARAVQSGKLDNTLRQLFDDSSESSLRESILPLLQSKSGRKALDAWLTREFERQTREIIDDLGRKVPHVVVGAGPHTFALLQENPHRGRVVVIEREVPGSTFYRRQFQLNSSQEIRANEIPGGRFQISDYKPRKDHPAPPQAHDLGFIIRLNYRAAGIRVLSQHEVVGGNFLSESGRVQLEVRNVVTSEQNTFLAKSVGIGTGFDNHRALRTDTLLFEEGLVMTSDNFLRAVFNEEVTASNLRGRRIAIIGGKHSAYTTAEAIVEMSPTTTIHMFGLRSQTASEFSREVTPTKGSPGFQRMIRNRYMGHGLPKAIEDGLLIGVDSRVDRIQPGRNKSVIVVDSEGARSGFDLVILATGSDPAEGLWSRIKSNPKNQNLEEVGFVGKNGDSMGLALVSDARRAGQRRVHFYSFGPGAALTINPDHLKGPIGNRDALFVTLPMTVELGQRLRLRPREYQINPESYLRKPQRE